MANTGNSLTSSQPYLLRALHEWISDNGETPLILVDVGMPGVDVPTEFVKDGRIVLNIATSATGELHLGNEAVSFNARFNGVARSVYVPVEAITSIVSRESGAGMSFQLEAAALDQEVQDYPERDIPDQPDDDDPQPTRPKGPSLRVVK